MMRAFAAVAVLPFLSSLIFAQTPRTALRASATQITAGQSVTLTAKVTSATGGAVPTGTISFQLGASSLGTEPLDASGVATLTITSLPTGSDAISAVYGGDANYAGSTSPAFTITVVVPQPDFAITDDPGTIVVTAGSSATTMLTVVPADGFNALVSFACSGLPSKSNCSFQPATVAPTGTAVTSRLTISTTAPTAAVAADHTPSRPESRLKLELAASGLLGCLLCLSGTRRGRGVLCLLALFGFFGFVLGCASSNIHKITVPGTPDGTYSVAIIASSGAGASAVSHTTQISLTVQ